METTDVIVIGGGIAGIGVAAMLSESAGVVVIERELHCGYHTTGRSAAMHIASYGPAAIRRLTAASEAYLLNPPDILDTESILSTRGEMALARHGEEDLLATFVKENPGHEHLSISDATGFVPILNPSRLSGAAYEKNARDIDVDRLLQSWLRLVSSRKGRVHTGHAVSSVKYVEQAWQVTAGDTTFEAPVVVNAAGAWADQIAVLACQSPLGLKPCRRSAALLPPPVVSPEAERDFLRWPMFAGVQEDWYARPMSGKLMVSPADEDLVEPHDAFADDTRIAEGLNNFEQMVTVEVTRVEHTWGGLRTFSKDREPVVGYAPGGTSSGASESEGFFWLAGQGGYGIQTSPALSKLAADLVLQHTLDDNAKELAALLTPARYTN